MLDPIVSLAFSVQSNKGVYALLLGSGLSRAAGIPTGWEVMLDLIRQSAAAHGEDCEPDPAEWFQSKFGREPDCSRTRPGFWMYRRSTARDSWHALAGTDRAIVDQQAIQEENGAVMAHQHRKLLSPSEKKKVDEINARMEARRQQWEKGRREGTSDSFWGYTEPLNPDAPGPAKEPLG